MAYSYKPLLFLMWLSLPFAGQSQSTNITKVSVDGSNLLQRIDGIGVNANTRSWDGKTLEPALELLLDSMNLSIWRVIAETVDNWEVVNDNTDPFTFNWKYYNRLYETPKFQKVWEMMAYLNRRGITDRLLVNFMGFAPRWMGNKVIEPKHEDEYVEMIVSFFHYAIKKKRLKFGLISPTNESDHHNFSEGPHLTGDQHAHILRKMILRMQELGIMEGIRIVAPDNASTSKALEEFIPAMMRDSLVMAHVAKLGLHTYSGDVRGVKQYIENSDFPDLSFWVTEWNAWCDGCDDGKLGEYNYQFARASVLHLISLLKAGSQACLLWEGYDSYYSHHAPSLFSYWGVLGYDAQNKTYYPRKHYYALRQVSQYLAPGCRQVAVSQQGDSLLLFAAIDSSSNQLVITGVNKNNHPVQLSVSTLHMPVVKSANATFTDSLNNNAILNGIQIAGDSMYMSVPADCIFTLSATLSTKKVQTTTPN